MGSSSDYPMSPWLRNAARQDAADVAAGRVPFFEDEWLARKREERAASRRKRDIWKYEDHEEIHPIDPSEVRY